MNLEVRRFTAGPSGSGRRVVISNPPPTPPHRCHVHVLKPSLVCCLVLQIRMPDNLYEMVVEVHEQVILPLGTDHSPRNGPTPKANAE